MKYCADPFESRCIRASQGALFDLPYCKGDLEDLQKFCKQKRLTLAVPIEDFQAPKGRLALRIGLKRLQDDVINST